MDVDARLPLRWVHFREGPEGAGVYVHVADLLYLLDTRYLADAIEELGRLLTARSSETSERGPS